MGYRQNEYYMNWYSLSKQASPLPWDLNPSWSEGADSLDYELGKEDVERIEERYGKDVAELLGTGAYGIALTLSNGRVLKITTDETEWKFAQELIENPLDFLVYVYYIEEINPYVYILELEKAVTLSESEKFVIRGVKERMNHVGWGMIHKGFRRDIYIKMLKRDKNVENLINRNEDLINKYIELIEDMKETGLNWVEAHANNLGWRNDQLILVDLGGLDISLKTH